MLYNKNVRTYTKKELKPYKILDILGMIFAAIGTFNNFYQGVDHPPFTESFFYPYTNILVPAVNIFTLVATIVYLFIPNQVWFLFFLYLLETVNLIFTGFPVVGITLYINFFAFFCAGGYAKSHFKIKFAVAALILISMISLEYRHSLTDIIYYVAFSSFEMECYFLLYFMLQERLCFLFKDVDVPGLAPEITLPPKGSVLNLKEMGLSERQISCIHYTLSTNFNFKKIAEELITSESTIKKEMQYLYKLFGVKNRELLRLLLIQYTIG